MSKFYATNQKNLRVVTLIKVCPENKDCFEWEFNFFFPWEIELLQATLNLFHIEINDLQENDNLLRSENKDLKQLKMENESSKFNYFLFKKNFQNVSYPGNTVFV
jgi:FtsZ-binding cell division protein ZapB